MRTSLSGSQMRLKPLRLAVSMVFKSCWRTFIWKCTPFWLIPTAIEGIFFLGSFTFIFWLGVCVCVVNFAARQDQLLWEVGIWPVLDSEQLKLGWLLVKGRRVGGLIQVDFFLSAYMCTIQYSKVNGERGQMNELTDVNMKLTLTQPLIQVGEPQLVCLLGIYTLTHEIWLELRTKGFPASSIAMEISQMCFITWEVIEVKQPLWAKL